jgi:hypothetical protein
VALADARGSPARYGRDDDALPHAAPEKGDAQASTLSAARPEASRRSAPWPPARTQADVLIDEPSIGLSPLMGPGVFSILKDLRDLPVSRPH